MVTLSGVKSQDFQGDYIMNLKIFVLENKTGAILWFSKCIYVSAVRMCCFVREIGVQQ